MLTRTRFYKFICPQFPLLSKATPPSPSESPTYLLVAIYLVASPFFNYDEYLSVEVVYNPLSPQTLLDIAWKCFSDNLGSSSIPVVQTALILLLISSKDAFNSDVSFK
jgi:hypothetical protein